MPTVRKDYIERLIEQLAEALAALLALRRDRKHEAAQALIRESSLSLLGMEYSVLTSMDARSVAQLLGHPEKIKALAGLIAEEAELLRQRGDEAGALARFERALALRLEARPLQRHPDPAGEEAIRALEASLAGA